MSYDLMASINDRAEAAIEIAEQNFGIRLDSSESSIAQVEEILSILHETIPKSFFAKLFKKGPTELEISHMTAAFGSYVGKVMMDHIGGTWSLESKAFPGESIATLHLTNGGDVWPMMKVRKRLENGPEDNVDHYYWVMSRKYGAKPQE